MAKQKINEQKRTMQKPEDELIFWEGHMRKIDPYTLMTQASQMRYGKTM